MKKKIIFRTQLVMLIAVWGFFSVFIYNKVKDIHKTQNQLTAVERGIDYEEATQKSLTSEDREKKNMAFILQQGREKLGLAFDDEVLFIKER